MKGLYSSERVFQNKVLHFSAKPDNVKICTKSGVIAMKKRILSIVLAAVSVFSLGAFLSSCSENKIEIAIPNDTTNEARALDYS